MFCCTLHLPIEAVELSLFNSGESVAIEFFEDSKGCSRHSEMNIVLKHDQTFPVLYTAFRC